MRSIFGWSYPPGAASDPNAPYNQDDPPCEVCGGDPGDCECPECPECGAAGDPDCYVHHGMERTDAQIKSKRTADRAQEDAEAGRYLDEQDQDPLEPWPYPPTRSKP